MSMLTPSGMGGKYRVTGNQYPRMRRPRRRGRIMAAAVASMVALGLISWGTLQLIGVFRGGGEKVRATAAHHTGCPPRTSAIPSATPSPSGRAAASGPLPSPDEIGISVFNATAKGGLAKSTADEMAKRGFRVVAFGNATTEYDKKVPQAALIVAGPAAESAARVVAAQFAGSTVKIDPKRADKRVDLFIGTAYTQPADPKDAEKALTAPTRPAPTTAPAAPAAKDC